MRVRRNVCVGYSGGAGTLARVCGTLVCVTLIGCASTEPVTADAGGESVQPIGTEGDTVEVATTASRQDGDESAWSIPREYEIDLDENAMNDRPASPESGHAGRIPDAGDGKPRLIRGFRINGLDAWDVQASELLSSDALLSATSSGWVEQRAGDRGTRFSLTAVESDPFGVVLYESALQAIGNTLRERMMRATDGFSGEMLFDFTIDQKTGMAQAVVAPPGTAAAASDATSPPVTTTPPVVTFDGRLLRGFEVDGLSEWGLTDLLGDIQIRVAETDGVWAASDEGRRVRLDRFGGDGVLIDDSVLAAAGTAVADAMQVRFPHHFAPGSLGGFVLDGTTGVASLEMPAPGAIPADDGPYVVQGFAVEGLSAWGLPDETARLRINVEDTGLGLIASPDSGRRMALRDLGDDQVVYQSVLNAASDAVLNWMRDKHDVEYGGSASFEIDSESGVAVLALQPPAPSAKDAEKGAVLVREVVVLGGDERGVTEEQVMDIGVMLSQAQDGFYAPRPGIGGQVIRIGDLPTLDGWGAYLYESSLPTIALAVKAEANRRGLRAVRVGIGWQDEGVLQIEMTQGVVSSLRTVVDAERKDPTLNDPKYQQIRDHSPIAEGDLVDIEALDSYVHRLNRRPGRQVDVALAPGQTDKDLTLDYLIAETSPFMLYAQATNTGTDETGNWRERFGLNHYNLTNFDDVLSLDYITGDFDSVHAVTASYERPLTSFVDPLRWRIFGKYVSYDASEVGFGSSAFEGETVGFGGELIWNVFQEKSAFVDLVGGVRYEDVSVDNNLINVQGESSFLLPYLGVRYEDQKPRGTTSAGVFVEWGSADEDVLELQELGRFDVDEDWTVVRWDGSHSFFLDPIFSSAWDDPSDDNPPTLAHEIVLTTRGQMSLGDRLVPNFVETVGGFYSVRGYPEAFAFGDRVYMGSIEYRFHLPRALGLSEPGEFFGNSEFRYTPQEALGPTDWDLIFRGFLDVGHAEHEDPLIFEDDTTLVGAGVGVELTLYRNVSLRVDWGVALKDAQVESSYVTSGSNRFHLAFTLVY